MLEAERFVQALEYVSVADADTAMECPSQDSPPDRLCISAAIVIAPDDAVDDSRSVRLIDNVVIDGCR